MKKKVRRVTTLFTLLFVLGTLFFFIQIYNFDGLTGYITFDSQEGNIPYFKLFNADLVVMILFLTGILVIIVFLVVKLGREHSRSHLVHDLR